MTARSTKLVVVELGIVVGKDGLVTEASVARSAGEAFDEAAVAAARRFVLEPARKDWEPIALLAHRAREEC